MRPTEVTSHHPPVAITEGVEYCYYSSNEPVRGRQQLFA